MTRRPGKRETLISATRRRGDRRRASLSKWTILLEKSLLLVIKLYKTFVLKSALDSVGFHFRGAVTYSGVLYQSCINFVFLMLIYENVMSNKFSMLNVFICLLGIPYTEKRKNEYMVVFKNNIM